MGPVNWFLAKDLFMWKVKMSVLLFLAQGRLAEDGFIRELHLLSTSDALTMREDKSMIPRMREWVPLTGCWTSSYSWGIRRWVPCSCLSEGKNSKDCSSSSDLCFVTDNTWIPLNFPIDEGMGPVNWLLDKPLFMRNMKISVMLFLIPRGITKGLVHHQMIVGVLTVNQDGSIHQWIRVCAPSTGCPPKTYEEYKDDCYAFLFLCTRDDHKRRSLSTVGVLTSTEVCSMHQ